jgi:hypothetical protein
LGGSASRRVSTSCSGLSSLSCSSFTRGTWPPFFLALLRQCSCSPEVLCLRTTRYPHLSLREPKEDSRWQHGAFPDPAPWTNGIVVRLKSVLRIQLRTEA